MLVHFAKQDSN